MRRMVAATAGALALLVLVAGCAAGPALSASVSTQLQSGVRSVAVAASAGDYNSATSTLATVQSQLNAAEDAHHVSADRALQIQALIDAVRADLEKLAGSPAVTPIPTPTPTPSVTPPEHTQEPKPGKGHGKHRP